MENKKSTFRNSIKIVLVLTLICVAVALLLAVVNNVTRDRIAENEIKERDDAIRAIIPDGDEVRSEVIDGTEVFYVLRDGELAGYCVPGVGTGFGGEIRTMVGFRPDGSICGVRIISMSETPGVGSKTKGEDFLAQFTGKTGPLEAGKKGEADIDAISGASISSRGVTEAVNNAAAVKVDPSAVPADSGQTGDSSAD